MSERKTSCRQSPHVPGYHRRMFPVCRLLFPFLGILCLLSLPRHAHAEEKSIAPDMAQAKSCHVELDVVSPEPESKHALLSTVTYRFRESHDSTCQLIIRMKQDKAFSCRASEKRHTPLPAEGTNRIQNEITLDCRYRLAGYYFSSPIFLDYYQGSRLSETRVLPNTPIQITLPPAHPDEENWLQVLRPWHRRVPSSIFWLLGGVVILISTFAIVARRRRATRLTALSAKPEEAPLSPIASFQADLAPLLEITPETEAAIKQYYDKLSAALRTYLAARLCLPVMESTTRQLNRILKDRLTQEHLDEISRILSACDLVKFSRTSPSPETRMTLVRDTGSLAASVETHITQLEQRDDVDPPAAPHDSTPHPKPQTSTAAYEPH